MTSSHSQLYCTVYTVHELPSQSVYR